LGSSVAVEQPSWAREPSASKETGVNPVRWPSLPVSALASPALLVCALTACSSSAGAPPPARPATVVRNERPNTLPNPIQHVVIIFQENRSFENVFAGFPGADAPMYGTLHDGRKVRLHPVSFSSAGICHNWATSIQDVDSGKMDGFDLNCSAPSYGGQVGRLVYSYLERASVQPYWAMAQRYVLADHMFPTELGGSFTAHLDVIAGTSNLSSTLAIADNPSNSPWGCDAPPGTQTTLVDASGQLSGGGPFPCLKQFRTIAGSLDKAQVSWKYYAPAVKSGDAGGSLWSAFDAIENVRHGPDWKLDVVSPETRVLTDISNHRLASVSWVIPDYENSDHAGSNSDSGPSWVASVVNAIGTSRYWRSTAIVVLWDEWGGWYDDAAPPQLDFRGLGIRVPCIIVSPYAKAGFVSHTQYEYGSILKFVEEVYSLPPLGPAAAGYTDTRANSLIDSFDFTQTPRRFVPIKADYPPSYFLQRAPSLQATDTE
jgi:phospholipase C